MTIRTISYDDATHKVVPLEPTNGMMESGRAAHFAADANADAAFGPNLPNGVHYRRNRAKAVFDTMLAAAPEVPSGWMPIETALPDMHVVDDSPAKIEGRNIPPLMESNLVLVSLLDGRVRTDKLIGLEGKSCWWDTHGSNVESWMPLPQPPSEAT